jgi:uncharacterized membrane protein YjdF
MRLLTHLSRSHWILLAVNAAYLFPLAGWFALTGDWEFFGYVLFLIFLLVVLLATIHKTHFPTWLLAMLSVWAAVHMAGGLVTIGDNVLYWLQLVHIWGEGDSYVLRFDQIVHFYGFFVTTFVAYWILLPQLKPGFRLGAIAFVAMLASMGFGAINEILEFIAVIFVPDNGVGGYYNTAIDIVANGLGALTAAIIIVSTKLGVEDSSERE